MKLPEFLFVIINPIMRLLLNSPLHGILSGSIMVISTVESGTTFTIDIPIDARPFEGAPTVA